MDTTMTTWVREFAPAKNPTELCILYALAINIDDTEADDWASIEALADAARCSERTARKCVKSLQERGLIEVAAERFTARYRLADTLGGSR